MLASYSRKIVWADYAVLSQPTLGSDVTSHRDGVPWAVWSYAVEL